MLCLGHLDAAMSSVCGADCLCVVSIAATSYKTTVWCIPTISSGAVRRMQDYDFTHYRLALVAVFFLAVFLAALASE